MVNLKKLVSLSLLVTSTLTFTACDKLTSKPKIECGDENSIKSTLAMLTQGAEKAIKDDQKGTSIASIRAAISSLKLSTKNVRTSKQDPNSTKVFCEADVILTAPVNVLSDATEALKTSGNKQDINLLLENSSMLPSSSAANSYETKIAYNLQPTDDGKTVISAIDEGKDNVIAGIHDIIIWSMAKKEGVKSNSSQPTLPQSSVQATTQPATKMIAPQNGLICSYQATISDNDKFNSSGTPIATGYTKASAAAILRQDRANFHKYNIRDTGDTNDCLMSSADQRANFEALVSHGTMDSATIHAILDSNPTVKVDLYANHADVVVK